MFFYSFPETNFEDFSKTQIDFSKTPNFTLNPSIPKISKLILPTVYIHFF